MIIKLEGSALEQRKQCEILQANNIDVIFDNYIIYVELEKGYQGYDLLEVIRNEELLGHHFFDYIKKEDIKKFITDDYNRNINKYAMFENYDLYIEDDSIKILNKARCFKLSLSLNFYQFDFLDNGLDLSYLDNRKIVFYIKKEDKLYTYFSKLNEELTDKKIYDSYDDSKKILLNVDEYGISITFEKALCNKSDNTVLIASNSDAWNAIDTFYNSVNAQLKRRSL